jgi:hypothetical protein
VVAIDAQLAQRLNQTARAAQRTRMRMRIRLRVPCADAALAPWAQGVPHYFKENAAQGNHKARLCCRCARACLLACADAADATSPPQVSAQKFSLLKEFVGVGCSARSAAQRSASQRSAAQRNTPVLFSRAAAPLQVLLTDTDVVYLQNPFTALYRDADIESMSDGWDAKTLYGAQAHANAPCARKCNAFLMRL